MLKPIFLIVAAAFALPLSAYAVQANLETNNSQKFKSGMNPRFARHHFHQKQSHHRGEKINKILQQLDLTPEQSQQIEGIKQEFETKNSPLKEEMQSNRQDIGLTFTSDASTAELRQQHQKVRALRQQLGDNHFEMMLQVREILTPEQRTQVAELIKQKKNRRL